MTHYFFWKANPLPSSVNCLNTKDKTFAPTDHDRPCVTTRTFVNCCGACTHHYLPSSFVTKRLIFY